MGILYNGAYNKIMVLSDYNGTNNKIMMTTKHNDNTKIIVFLKFNGVPMSDKDIL